MTKQEILEQLKDRSDGIAYMSETDRPCETVEGLRLAKGLTAQYFLKAMNKPPLTPIESVELDLFFNNQGDTDEDWFELRDYMESVFQGGEIRVFKTFENPANNNDYHLFVVGLFEMNLLGIQSNGIAT